jgi:hypothetical protein
VLADGSEQFLVPALAHFDLDLAPFAGRVAAGSPDNVVVHLDEHPVALVEKPVRAPMRLQPRHRMQLAATSHAGYHVGELARYLSAARVVDANLPACLARGHLHLPAAVGTAPAAPQRHPMPQQISVGRVEVDVLEILLPLHHAPALAHQGQEPVSDVEMG